MASQDLINIGLYPDSGTGDSARRGGQKINTLFADIYANFGDNPIITDTADSDYGQRRKFKENEFKVGELHPAGKFITVDFATPTTKSTAIVSPTVNGWDDTTDTDGDGIPDIFDDSEWYFLSRGEQLNIDLSNIALGGVVHLVLPLGVAGDRIVLRDTYNNWKDKKLSFWTTPYNFQDSEQIVNWANNLVGYPTISFPDSDFASITDQNNKQYYAPYKSGSSAVAALYDGVHQEFSRVQYNTSDKSSPCFVTPSSQGTEIEFFHRGGTFLDSDGQQHLGGWYMIVKSNMTDFFSSGFTDLDSDFKYIGSGIKNTQNLGILNTPAAAIVGTPQVNNAQTGFLIDNFKIHQVVGDGGFTTAKYIIQARTTTDNTENGTTANIQASELLVTIDNGSDNVHINEYSIVSNVNRVAFPTDDLITYSAWVEISDGTNGSVAGEKHVVIRAVANSAVVGTKPVIVKSFRTAVIE